MQYLPKDRTSLRAGSIKQNKTKQYQQQQQHAKRN
jgi:hypothetical protein